MERQEQAKLAAAKLAAEIGVVGGGMEVRDECSKPAQPHPREILLRDLRDHEERLLDKLVAIRALRHEYEFLSRDEAERLLKMGRLSEQLLR